jgi:hypothetical protein
VAQTPPGVFLSFSGSGGFKHTLAFLLTTLSSLTLSHNPLIASHRLQVTVTVNIPDGTDPSGVFLSLSGSSGFKHNTRLGPDRTSTFQGLQPGTFYLKPLLREHSFDPPVADIQLEDGQQMQLGLTAVRAAWGISGAVKSGRSPVRSLLDAWFCGRRSPGLSMIPWAFSMHACVPQDR